MNNLLTLYIFSACENTYVYKIIHTHINLLYLYISFKNKLKYSFLIFFFFCFFFFQTTDSDSTEADATVQDMLTCGTCQKVFALSDIVKFIQHKVLQCNKENYGQCSNQGKLQTNYILLV